MTISFVTAGLATIPVTVNLPAAIFMGSGYSPNAVVMSGRPPGSHVTLSGSIVLDYATLSSESENPDLLAAATLNASQQLALLAFIVAAWTEILAFGYPTPGATNV